ncbi:MAG: hypothetical protein IJW92_05935 [Clostridia bacterium]|nr:hypothetical protein [Clostridia bacterium]
MKYKKSILVLYLISALKLIMTFIYFFGFTSDFYYLTIISIPMCIANMFNEKIALLCVVILAVTLLIWLVAVVLSIFGIKFQRARIGSVFMFALATVIDFGSVFLSDNWVLKIVCSIISAFVLLISIKALCDINKNCRYPK